MLLAVGRDREHPRRDGPGTTMHRPARGPAARRDRLPRLDGGPRPRRPRRGRRVRRGAAAASADPVPPAWRPRRWHPRCPPSSCGHQPSPTGHRSRPSSRAVVPTSRRRSHGAASRPGPPRSSSSWTTLTAAIGSTGASWTFPARDGSLPRGVGSGRRPSAPGAQRLRADRVRRPVPALGEPSLPLHALRPGVAARADGPSGRRRGQGGPGEGDRPRSHDIDRHLPVLTALAA